VCVCVCIVKEGCISEDSKLSVVLPIHKEEDDPRECDSTDELNCSNMLQKWWKGSSNAEFDIHDMQFGNMNGKGITDVIFIVRQMQQKFRAKRKKCYMYIGFAAWKKLLMGFQVK